MLCRRHSSSLVVTRRHSSSLVITRRHSSSLVVTRRHSLSLVVTRRHSSSLVVTRRHSSSLVRFLWSASLCPVQRRLCFYSCSPFRPHAIPFSMRHFVILLDSSHRVPTRSLGSVRPTDPSRPLGYSRTNATMDYSLMSRPTRPDPPVRVRPSDRPRPVPPVRVPADQRNDGLEFNVPTDPTRPAR